MNQSKTVAALFDFDGVIMDTESQYSLFWSEQGKKYHPEISSFEQLVKGTTLDQIFDRYFKDQPDIQNQIRQDLDEYEKNMKYEYVPGVKSFLRELRMKGVKIAVVTSSNQVKMKNIYSVHPEFEGLVDKILTAEYFSKSKPDPECFLLGAELFDVSPSDCVVFEDSFNGLEAANRAKMHVVGLSTTNSPESICDKAQIIIPDFQSFNYDEMMKLFN